MEEKLAAVRAVPWAVTTADVWVNLKAEKMAHMWVLHWAEEMARPWAAKTAHNLAMCWVVRTEGLLAETTADPKEPKWVVKTENL